MLHVDDTLSRGIGDGQWVRPGPCLCRTETIIRAARGTVAAKGYRMREQALRIAPHGSDGYQVRV